MSSCSTTYGTVVHGLCSGCTTCSQSRRSGSRRYALSVAIPYTTPIPSTSALEEEVRAARTRHRERLDALEQLSAEHVALGEEISVEAKATATPERYGWWSRLWSSFGRERSIMRTAALEERVEQAWRRVLAMAHHLDRLAADRVMLRREIEILEARIAQYEHCAVLALTAQQAFELSDAFEEAQLAQADHHVFSRAARRLSAIVSLHREILQLDLDVEGRLSALHVAGTNLLDALDADLVRLASEARLQQLSETFATDLVALRESVVRVNRCATEGAILFTEDLDRLADEVEPLASVDPQRIEAEREVSIHLRSRSVNDAVASARQTAVLRERLRGRAPGDNDPS